MSEEKLKLTIDRLEADKAVLRTDDGQELVVGLNLIPAGISEGDKLFVYFSFSAVETTRAKISAKDLIKAILSNNKS